jgi:hypothetical protein
MGEWREMKRMLKFESNRGLEVEYETKKGRRDKRRTSDI